ncbi:hypothetical protein D9M69_652160 [compost metagenome]
MEVVVTLADQPLNAVRMDAEMFGSNLECLLRTDISRLRGKACVEVARLVQVAHGGGLKNL